MADAGRNAAAQVTIGMAFGQAALAVALSGVATRSNLRSFEEYQRLVQLPLWFAVVPFLSGLGLLIHMRLCRHVDQACPWLGLAWILMALNLAALLVSSFNAM